MAHQVCSGYDYDSSLSNDRAVVVYKERLMCEYDLKVESKNHENDSLDKDYFIKVE